MRQKPSPHLDVATTTRKSPPEKPSISVSSTTPSQSTTPYVQPNVTLPAPTNIPTNTPTNIPAQPLSPQPQKQATHRSPPHYQVASQEASRAAPKPTIFSPSSQDFVSSSSTCTVPTSMSPLKVAPTAATKSQKLLLNPRQSILPSNPPPPLPPSPSRMSNMWLTSPNCYTLDLASSIPYNTYFPQLLSEQPHAVLDLATSQRLEDFPQFFVDSTQLYDPALNICYPRFSVAPEAQTSDQHEKQFYQVLPSASSSFLPLRVK